MKIAEVTKSFDIAKAIRERDRCGNYLLNEAEAAESIQQYGMNIRDSLYRDSNTTVNEGHENSKSFSEHTSF